MNNLHQVSKIETNKKMIISPAGWLGEAPLGACVLLWASTCVEGVDHCKPLLSMTLISGDVPPLGLPFLIPQNPLHTAQV